MKEKIDTLIEQYFVEDKFGEIYGSKHEWEDVTQDVLEKNPDLRRRLHDLIEIAYEPIGGHIKFQKPSDLLNRDLKFFQAIDVDDDSMADALKIGKRKSGGIKSTGMGHDGSREAKDAVLDHSAELLFDKGFYAEMSKAMAHIMITRYSVPFVGDPEVVQEVLGPQKPIDWVGEHPDGKYPDYDGWYYRKIGGERHIKIMLGKPHR